MPGTMRNSPSLTSSAARTVRGGATGLIVVLGVFTAFIWGYPRLFPAIERDAPAQYRERVAELIAAGEAERARRWVARVAALRTHDPDAWALLGNLELEAGRVPEAVAHFERAVQVDRTLQARPTRRPLYHPEARLGLARVAVAQGDMLEALGHLELGWRYAVDPVPAFTELYGLAGWPSRATVVSPDKAAAPADDVAGQQVRLDTVRQYFEWDPCRTQHAVLNLKGDDLLDLSLTWPGADGAQAVQQFRSLPNQVPMEVLAHAAWDEAWTGHDVRALPLVLPGWSTTPHLWHEGAELTTGDGSLRIRRSVTPGNALVTTLPVVHSGPMFVAVRTRAKAGARVSVTWLAEDALEQESFRDALPAVTPATEADDWTWHAAFHPGSVHWEANWLQVGIFDGTGEVWIDRVVMLALPDAPPCHWEGAPPG